jgi:DNA-binding transcriptional MerR regulator
MYGIGTVARLAQVSVRTLRHYDEIGLLTPAAVNPQTGYRYYTPGQLHRLHRILVLRDLGLPLAEIGGLLDDEVTVEQLRGILQLRRQQAHARLETHQHQLARVEARLAHLEDQHMNNYEVTVKRLDPLRVVALSEDLADHTEIATAAGRLYPRLHAALGRHRVGFSGVSYALYEHTEDPDRPLRLTVGLPVPDDVTIAEDGITTLELSEIGRAATTVVKGPPTRFAEAFAAIHDWIERTGEKPTRFEREVYLDCDGPPETWVTELQQLLELA